MNFVGTKAGETEVPNSSSQGIRCTAGKGMGMQDHVTIFCQRCQRAGRIGWSGAVGNAGERSIGSLSEGFNFIVDDSREPRVECDKCHHTVGELHSLLRGWDLSDIWEELLIESRAS